MITGLGIGVWNAFSTKLITWTIEVEKLENPVTILFVSDLHVDDVISTRHLQHLKQIIHEQQPDIVLL